MQEMTKEERVLCALSREQPDRVPLYDLVSSIAMIEHYGKNRFTLENSASIIPYAMSQALDTTRIFLPGPLGIRVDERSFTYERRDWFNEWQTGVPFHDFLGLVAFVKNEIERLNSWQPVNPDTALAELKVWKERYAGTVLPASWAGEALQDNYIQIGLDWFIWLDAEEPELTRIWIEARHNQLMRRLQSENYCRVISPIAWIFGDVAYKDRLIFSPAYLHKHGFFLHLKEICDLYYSFGLKIIFHSDGFIYPIIQDLIVAGVDAIAPVDTMAGLDLAVLKNEFGNHLAFVGGIDVENVLSQGNVDLVRQATLNAIKIAAPGGGFILGSSSEELFDSLPLENIITMIETTRECGVYPIGSAFPRSYVNIKPIKKEN